MSTKQKQEKQVECNNPSSNDKKYNRSNNRNKPKNDRRQDDSRNPKNFGRDINDPIWRQYDKMIADQVNSFALNRIAGTDFSPASKFGAGVLTGPTPLARMELYPSAGRAMTPTDAINQLGLKTYTDLTANNMKTVKYGPQDVTTLLLALNSIVATSTFIRRAFGVIGTVSPRNFVYPRHLIRNGMGIDYDDFKTKIANYRAKYNAIAALASSISFPSEFECFKSTISLFQDIFLDHASDMAQVIVTYPRSYWILEDATDPQGTKLKSHVMGFEPQGQGKFDTMDEWLNVLQQQIGALLNSAVLQEMYPDVLKYANNFGSKMFSLPYLETEYAVKPVYSEEFMTMFENHVCLGTPNHLEDTSLYTSDNDVLPNANYNSIRYNPSFTLATGNSMTQVYASALYETIINFHEDSPSTDLRTVATRFKYPVALNNADMTSGITASFYLTDWFVSNTYFVPNQSSQGQVIGLADGDVWHLMQAMSSFAHVPVFITSMIKVDTAAKTRNLLKPSIYGEMDVWTSVDDHTMQTINEFAVMSLFSFKKPIISKK